MDQMVFHRVVFAPAKTRATGCMQGADKRCIRFRDTPILRATSGDVSDQFLRFVSDLLAASASGGACCTDGLLNAADNDPCYVCDRHYTCSW